MDFLPIFLFYIPKINHLVCFHFVGYTKYNSQVDFWDQTLTFIFCLILTVPLINTNRSSVSGGARASLSLAVQTDGSRCNWEEGEENLTLVVNMGLSN